MKRAFFIAAALLTFVSCGQGDAPGFGREDLYINIGGASYGLDVSIGEVIAALGEGYEYAEAQSCDYDGLDKTFIYDTAEFYTFPLDKGDTVCEVYSASAEASTSKGVRVGAKKEDVIAAYGPDCEDTGYQLIYAAEGGSLCFDIENGAVKAFYVTTRPF